jgi:electron transfer flavoprotein alpha subunit
MPSPAEQNGEVVQVLVCVDARGHWTPHSLELLSDARTVANRWNSTVGAWVLTPPSHPKLDSNELAAHGCSCLRHLKQERFANWSSEAIAAALHAHRSASTRLVLLPGTARGEEVAALLAERMQALWIPDALTFSVTRVGALEITAVQADGKLSRTVRPSGVAVVTMRPGVAEARREKPVEIAVREETVDLSNVPSLTTVEKLIPADPSTVDITFANKIVSAGRGTGGTEGVQLVAKLADALHASLGASRMVVDLGWLPHERQVGQTGKTVKPDLYVACGISGATHHLAGMRDSKHIVAINSDPQAPIHDVAHLSLKGDLKDVIPSVIAALSRRRPG